MPHPGSLHRARFFLTALILGAALVGCALPEDFLEVTVVNPCSYPIEVWSWFAPQGEEPRDRGMPNNGTLTVPAYSSRGFLSVRDLPQIVRIDQLGFRQELIPPPGGELSDVVLTPDPASCQGS
jgi:hypothetical protein